MLEAQPYALLLP